MGTASLKKLAKALMKNTSVISLNLAVRVAADLPLAVKRLTSVGQGNNFGDEGASMLAPALLENTTLATLNLSVSLRPHRRSFLSSSI